MVNAISYQGRVVDTERMPARLGKSGNGLVVLTVTIAETHTQKKGAVKKDPALKHFAEADRAKGKTDDDYIDTTTSWHKLTVFGAKAEEIAQDEDFNHGAVVQITEASYVEEGEWETRDGVKRAGRPESIGDKAGSIEVYSYNGKKFGPRDPKPAMWDGITELPPLKGQGSGQAPEFNVADDQGF